MYIEIKHSNFKNSILTILSILFSIKCMNIL